MTGPNPAALIGAAIAKLRRFSSPFWRLEARFKGVEFQGRSEFLGRPLISVAAGGLIVLGDGIQILSPKMCQPIISPLAIRPAYSFERQN
jgi:hypothetical protein